ncbi:head-tail adaptor protein [Thalassovita sp.]|uniref:head-tail adaptor protein n=1 Tax=Thalassovita sp. TaxID=1979401 RepID=UPI002B270BCE|nr:head-tail adaptor protein [Thalassovita sp.]
MRQIEKIRFYALVDEADEYGNEVAGWADEPFLTVRAEVVYAAGGEAIQAAALDALKTARALFRVGGAARRVTEADKAVIGGVGWNIRSVVWIGRGQRRAELMLERLGEDG